MGLLNKFPSFRNLQANAIGAVRRFPLALLSAVVSTVIALILIEYKDQESELNLLRVLLTAYLGLPLFIALVFTAEKRRWRWQISYAWQGLGVILLVAYFFTLPDGVENISSCMLRFGLLAVGLHFLVACLPYLGGNQTRGFWQFNMTLFRRVLTAAVFSAVMYIGLAIALGAWDQLFGFDVKEERYFQLWVVMAGIFNTWIFLAGVPKDLDALDHATDHPKGLAIFAQYILLPLVGLYFVILIAYEAKIIIEWNWPIGWVSELVLWFSVVGLLTLLLLYPLRKQSDKRWVQTFVKWFFRAMVPLVILLFLAILRRISDYGVTEPRYLVLGMAVGLVIVTLYFLISKSKDIRIIPILLGALAFLGAYGPWSASSVSLWSQQGRLETLLTQNGLLAESTIQEPGQKPSFEDRKEMSSIIDYVVDWHGTEPFERWVGEDVVDSLDSAERSAVAREAAEACGIDFVGQYATSDPDSAFSISGRIAYANTTSFMVTGYDYLVDFDLGPSLRGCSYPFVTDSCRLNLDTVELALDLSLWKDRGSTEDILRFELSDTLNSLIERDNEIKTPLKDRTFVVSGKEYEARLVLEHVTGDRTSEGLWVRSLGGHLLIRRH